MGKSRRFHKRVQKRHTRKHKPTRKKNKMKKNYSIKQRGGNPISILAITAASIAGLSFLIYELINMGKHTTPETNEIRRVLNIVNQVVERKPPSVDQISTVLKAIDLSPTPITEEQIIAILRELEKKSSDRYPELKKDDLVRILESSKNIPEEKVDTPAKKVDAPAKKVDAPSKKVDTPAK